METSKRAYVNEWLIAAELSLRDAEMLCFYGGSYGNMIFHIRQALECGIKALLASSTVPPTHSYSKLRDFLNQRGILDLEGEEELKPYMGVLRRIGEDDLRHPYIDDFNAPAIPWPSISRGEALEIWRAGKAIHEWIVKRITNEKSQLA